jgi:predicted Zn finger-like uncharacterized protein
MILTCTSCSTRYYADDAAIGPTGRTVRCAACGHSWFADTQGADAEIERPQKPEPLTRERVERLRRAAEQPGPAPSAAAKFRAQQAERMRRERARAAIAAWGATGAAVAASVAGMVVFRQDVAEVWPNSATAYAAVGLDVNVYGLEFFDLAVERSFDGPTPILLISGEVRNIAREDKIVPPVRVTLRDSNSSEIYDMVYAIESGPVGAGQAAQFQFRLDNPPADAVDLETSFASFAEAGAASLAPRVSPPAMTHDQPLDLTEPAELHEPALEAPAAFNGAAAPVEGLAPRFSASDAWATDRHG